MHQLLPRQRVVAKRAHVHPRALVAPGSLFERLVDVVAVAGGVGGGGGGEGVHGAELPRRAEQPLWADAREHDLVRREVLEEWSHSAAVRELRLQAGPRLELLEPATLRQPVQGESRACESR